MQDTTTARAEQRLNALRKANDIRSRRAREKKVLANGGGRALAAKLLAEVPGHWASATVEQLLISVPGVGKIKCRRICNTLTISPTRALDRLTERQRGRLIEAIAR